MRSSDMNRRLHGFWAGAISGLACLATLVAWVYLSMGPRFTGGVLAPVLEGLGDVLGRAFGTTAAFYLLHVWWVLPPGFVALVTYERLRLHAYRDYRMLRCLKCAHILKGLSEPRCPECGERI